MRNYICENIQTGLTQCFSLTVLRTMRDKMDVDFKNKVVDNLFLRHHEEEEQYAAWPELRQLIQSGNTVLLADYLVANDLDIKRIRFQVQ